MVYCKSVHFHGFEQARSHGKCYEMSSFSESKAKKLAKEAGTVNKREHEVSNNRWMLIFPFYIMELFIAV